LRAKQSVNTVNIFCLEIASPPKWADRNDVLINIIAYMNTCALLPTAYLAPVQYYSKIKNYQSCIIEHFENFPKQTYRSRCNIYSPNGTLTLSIPLLKRNHRQLIKDIKISYEYDWQKLHWRSLEASYRSSPFFEYYEDDLFPFYHEKKPKFLLDLNAGLHEKILCLLKLKTPISVTAEYTKAYNNTDDFRELINPKNTTVDPTFEAKPYYQVFENKHGFIPNLSVVDVLFNQGSRALDYI
jgi:hypothetical protein